MLRIPNCVVNELQRADGLRWVERIVYIGAWMHEPKSISELSRVVKMDRGAISRACRVLVDQKWMAMIPQKGTSMPVAAIPHACQEVMAKDLTAEYALVSRRGEHLTNKRLDWYLQNDEYIRNARPDFLKNPKTGKPMEYDRFDRKNHFASEFNGTQHYRASDEYGEDRVKDQQVRDLMKESLSIRNGITLLIVTSDDLRPGILESKLDKLVPHLKRNYVDMNGHYISALNRLCSSYASVASEQR